MSIISYSDCFNSSNISVLCYLLSIHEYQMFGEAKWFHLYCLSSCQMVHVTHLELIQRLSSSHKSNCRCFTWDIFSFSHSFSVKQSFKALVGHPNKCVWYKCPGVFPCNTNYVNLFGHSTGQLSTSTPLLVLLTYIICSHRKCYFIRQRS